MKKELWLSMALLIGLLPPGVAAQDPPDHVLHRPPRPLSNEL